MHATGQGCHGWADGESHPFRHENHGSALCPASALEAKQ